MDQSKTKEHDVVTFESCVVQHTHTFAHGARFNANTVCSFLLDCSLPTLWEPAVCVFFTAAKHHRQLEFGTPHAPTFLSPFSVSPTQLDGNFYFWGGCSKTRSVKKHESPWQPSLSVMLPQFGTCQSFRKQRISLLVFVWFAFLAWVARWGVSIS